MAKAAEQFVIWTRYERPHGDKKKAKAGERVVVRHCFGPFPTRAKAQAALKKMLREPMNEPRPGETLETVVTKLIGGTHG